MLLRNSLFCVFLGSLFYTSEGQSTQASGENLEAAANALLGSLFGTRNAQVCVGGNCESQPDEWEEISSAHYVTNYKETKPGYVVESGPSVQTEAVYEDEYSKFCRDLTTVIKEIEYINPEFKTVKHEVLEKFGRYSLEFASQLKKCYTGPAAIQLLDLIILVAEKIKSEYEPVEIKPYPEPEEQTYEPIMKPYPEPEEQTYEPIMKPYPEPEEQTYEPIMKPYPEPEEQTYEPIEEIVAEEVEVGDLSPGFVGSVRGIPGEHFPNYAEVPITSFSCADKKYIPGFYADLETGCQVFHVCYEHRRESFLCPVGTIFNQPILACDYWYSSNCSLAPVYYDVNKQTEEVYKPNEMESTIGALITTIIEGEEPVVPEIPVEVSADITYEKHDIADIVKFLPVKAEVFEFPEPIAQKPFQKDELADTVFETVISSGTSMASKTKHVIENIPQAEVVKTLVVQPATFVKTISIPAKKVAKVAAIKASVPVVAKAKLAVAAVPVAKAMKVAVPVAAAMKASVPLVKAAAVKPVVAKAKIAGAVPLVKAAAIKSTAPIVVKAAAIKSTAPIVVKAAAIKSTAPIVVKAAAIKSTAPIVVKAKVAAAGIPASKIATKAAVPLFAKTKIAMVAPSVKAKVAVPVAKVVASSALKAKAIPMVKTKVAALPVMKAKLAKTATVPLVKGKMVALPLAKAKFAGASIPFVKAKAAGLPLVKHAAVKAIPAIKGKVAKAAMLSPLTKKALALGYMKLLKAKKLGMMG